MPEGNVEKPSLTLTQRPGVRFGAAAIIIAVAAVAIWLWATAGRESTDDAQIDAHVTQVSARVAGTILKVSVDDNQIVDAGAVLVELDPRDYQVAADKARAELADAEAAAQAAQSNVPITSTTAAGNVATARGGIAQADSGVTAGEKEIDAARARVTTAQARQREADANATKAARDVERLRGLLAKDEVSQQQFDATVAAAEAQKAAADSAKSQVAEAEAGIRVAESKLAQARAGRQQAQAELQTAETAPQQVAAIKARAASAEAHVQQARANLAQAELNLQYATVKAPVRGVVSKKGINAGQVVQAGQPLLAIVREGGQHRGRPARASRCCHPRTPQGTTSRSSSGSRSKSCSIPARTRIACCGPACRSHRRCTRGDEIAELQDGRIAGREGLVFLQSCNPAMTP